MNKERDDLKQLCSEIQEQLKVLKDVKKQEEIK